MKISGNVTGESVALYTILGITRLFSTVIFQQRETARSPNV